MPYLVTNDHIWSKRLLHVEGKYMSLLKKKYWNAGVPLFRGSCLLCLLSIISLFTCWVSVVCWMRSGWEVRTWKVRREHGFTAFFRFIVSLYCFTSPRAFFVNFWGFESSKTWLFSALQEVQCLDFFSVRTQCVLKLL